MDNDLKECLESLHDFRAFWLDRVAQTMPGSGNTNPIWVRVADILEKHGMNEGPSNGQRYFNPETEGGAKSMP